MIDYLYRLDYDDDLPSENLPTAEQTLPEATDPPVVSPPESAAPDEAATDPSGNGPDRRTPWDYNLTSKEKKRKERQMRLDGTWESRLTQKMIDEDEAMAQVEPELELEKLRLQGLPETLDTERIVVNANLYALADKYGIPDLKLLAKTKFSTAAAQNWRSEAFVRAAGLAFKNTPSSDFGLRSIVIKTLIKHWELINYEEVQDLLDTGNGIAWQLVKVLLSRPESRRGQSPASSHDHSSI